jgi:hypothetical protein
VEVEEASRCRICWGDKSTWRAMTPDINRLPERETRLKMFYIIEMTLPKYRRSQVEGKHIICTCVLRVLFVYILYT